MNRRSFLAACIATASAPMIVRASSLMPLRPIDWRVVPLWPVPDATFFAAPTPSERFTYSADVQLALPGDPVFVRRIWAGDRLIHDSAWSRMADGRIHVRVDEIEEFGYRIPDISVEVRV